ncbi:MAG: hypothetical protein M1379_13900 [Firmicutes bacterium]|nr:hypothetical protein [Bacillota bacterium]
MKKNQRWWLISVIALILFFAAFGTMGYLEYAGKSGGVTGATGAAGGASLPASIGASGEVSTEAGKLPKTIEGLTLANVVSGKAALDQISQLHGTNIQMTSGDIATYEKGQEKVIVWMGRAKNAAGAQALLDEMVGKMANSKVFEQPQKLVIKDRAYYYTVGAGMSNYFYVKDDSVYWIGAVTPNEVNVVKTIIRVM